MLVEVENVAGQPHRAGADVVAAQVGGERDGSVVRDPQQPRAPAAARGALAGFGQVPGLDEFLDAEGDGRGGEPEFAYEVRAGGRGTVRDEFEDMRGGAGLLLGGGHGAPFGSGRMADGGWRMADGGWRGRG